MLDWDRISELKSEVGEDAFDEVLELFLEEVDEVIGKLSPRTGDTDFAEAMHFLRGSAANLGFQSMAELCLANERLALSDGAQTVDIAALVTCYDASRDALRTGCALNAA